MSTVSVRIDEDLWKKVQRKAKKSRNTIINYINSAIEEKLEREKPTKNANIGGPPLPSDYAFTSNVKIIDPSGKEHPLK
jgi:hypothetical protein